MKRSENSTRAKTHPDKKEQKTSVHHAIVNRNSGNVAHGNEEDGGQGAGGRGRKRHKVDREQEAREWLARHSNPKRMVECHEYSQDGEQQEMGCGTGHMACERMAPSFATTSIPTAACIMGSASTVSIGDDLLRLQWKAPRGIKAIPEHERPREKLLSKGVSSLNDAELLALLIGTGTHSMSVLDLAQRLLNHCGGMVELGRLQASDLQEVGGIGAAKASQIIASFELARRQQAASKRFLYFNSPRQVAEFVRTNLAHLPNEVFKVILFNAANNILAERDLFVGGFNGTTVDPRVIYKFALQHHATKIVLCHNHPSGDCKPSEPDLAITEQIVRAGAGLGIKVIDHIIITTWGYYSFADNGLLSQIERNLKEANVAAEERSILRQYRQVKSVGEVDFDDAPLK